MVCLIAPNRRPVVVDATAACGVSFAWISAAMPSVKGDPDVDFGKTEVAAVGAHHPHIVSHRRHCTGAEGMPGDPAAVGTGSVSTRASSACTRPT